MQILSAPYCLGTPKLFLLTVQGRYEKSHRPIAIRLSNHESSSAPLEASSGSLVSSSPRAMRIGNSGEYLQVMTLYSPSLIFLTHPYIGPFLVGNIKKLLPIMVSKASQLASLMGEHASTENGGVVEGK